MKLHEFLLMCKEAILEVKPTSVGYTAGFKCCTDDDHDFQGAIWEEIESQAESFDGGTTYFRGHGRTPNAALKDFCGRLAGRLLRFGKNMPYQHVRAPQELKP